MNNDLVHEVLFGVKEDLGIIKGKLDMLTASVQEHVEIDRKRFDMHDKQIGSLQRHQYIATGGIAVLTFVVTHWWQKLLGIFGGQA